MKVYLGTYSSEETYQFELSEENPILISIENGVPYLSQSKELKLKQILKEILKCFKSYNSDEIGVIQYLDKNQYLIQRMLDETNNKG